MNHDIDIKIGINTFIMNDRLDLVKYMLRIYKCDKYEYYNFLTYSINNESRKCFNYFCNKIYNSNNIYILLFILKNKNLYLCKDIVKTIRDFLPCTQITPKNNIDITDSIFNNLKDIQKICKYINPCSIYKDTYSYIFEEDTNPRCIPIIFGAILENNIKLIKLLHLYGITLNTTGLVDPNEKYTLDNGRPEYYEMCIEDFIIIYCKTDDIINNILDIFKK